MNGDGPAPMFEYAEPLRPGVDRVARLGWRGGHPLDEFLDDFPSVSREQVVAALEVARDALLRTPAV